MNLKNYVVASFCNEDSKTIPHGVFFICDKGMPLWNNFSMLIHRKTAKRLGFNVCNTILRETPLSSENRIVNFFNFTGLIYHLKFKNKTVSLISFLETNVMFHFKDQVAENDTMGTSVFYNMYIVVIYIVVIYIHALGKCQDGLSSVSFIKGYIVPN